MVLLENSKNTFKHIPIIFRTFKKYSLKNFLNFFKKISENSLECVAYQIKGHAIFFKMCIYPTF